MPLTYVIEDLNGEETVGTFYEKKLQKANHTEFIKKKRYKLYVKWKGCDNLFHSRIHKKIWLYKRSYFPEPYTDSKHEIKAELDLSNDSTKYDLKNATGVDKSDFAN